MSAAGRDQADGPGGAELTSYDAARSTAAYVERSDRARMEFSGAKAMETLNGIFTNNVSTLKPGEGHYAAALTNKGKVVADVRIFARRDGYLVDTSAAAGPAFVTMIRKYVNPRLAAYRDVSSEFGTLGVFGPAASGAIASAAAGATAGATGVAAEELDALAAFSHTPLAARAPSASTPTHGFIARVPDLGITGYDIIAPHAVLDAIRDALRSIGTPAMDAATTEVLRIEAGRPLWGTDIDETTLAQEAALDRPDLNAIAFDKGCYTGQETVARVHFRGHVNRVLRGIRSDTPLNRGWTLHGSDGAPVGEVRSVAHSPRLGAIALALVRREIETGTAVAVRRSGQPDAGDASSGQPAVISARVVALPFD